MSWLFPLGGQSIGASASASVLPMNIQVWFPLFWLIWSPCSPRDSQESSPTPRFESINSSMLSLLYGPTLIVINDYWKNHSFDYMSKRLYVRDKVMSLLFNMLSGFVIAFLPRSKCLLISWLKSLSSVFLEPKKIKSATVFIFSRLNLPWYDRTRCHDLFYDCWVLSQLFRSPLSPSSSGSLLNSI